MAVGITIAVNGKVIRQIDNVPWQSGMNAQDAMEHAYHTGTGYSFMLQYFGPDLGYEVVNIDNIASQSGTDTYVFWEFRVNNTISQKGIDQVILNDGDKIGWNYIPYDLTAHGSGRYAAIKTRIAANR